MTSGCRSGALVSSWPCWPLSPAGPAAANPAGRQTRARVEAALVGEVASPPAERAEPTPPRWSGPGATAPGTTPGDGRRAGAPIPRPAPDPHALSASVPAPAGRGAFDIGAGDREGRWSVLPGTCRMARSPPISRCPSIQDTMCFSGLFRRAPIRPTSGGGTTRSTFPSPSTTWVPTRFSFPIPMSSRSFPGSWSGTTIPPRPRRPATGMWRSTPPPSGAIRRSTMPRGRLLRSQHPEQLPSGPRRNLYLLPL